MAFIKTIGSVGGFAPVSAAWSEKFNPIAINFPGLVIHEPNLVFFEISGSDDKSTFLIFSNVSKFKLVGSKSFIYLEISRKFPSLSNIAGFSLFFSPTLSNFISSPIIIYSFCIASYDHNYLNPF